MSKVTGVTLGAGFGGLLLWLGVRGSRWVKGELAYYRWRRQRLHEITLRAPEAISLQSLTSGRALVWDDRRDRAAS